MKDAIFVNTFFIYKHAQVYNNVKKFDPKYQDVKECILHTQWCGIMSIIFVALRMIYKENEYYKSWCKSDIESGYVDDVMRKKKVKNLDKCIDGVESNHDLFLVYDFSFHEIKMYIYM